MTQQLNENCRVCLLKQQTKTTRLLLTSCRFLELIEKSLRLEINFDSSQLNTEKLTFELSIPQICFLLRLLKLERITFSCDFSSPDRSITSIEFRSLQHICNVIKENENIKKIKLENVDRCEQLLFDQLPDRIVNVSCQYRVCTLLLGRQCPIEELTVFRKETSQINFNHVFKVKARKIVLSTYCHCNLDKSGPFKQNDAIEMIVIDIVYLYYYTESTWRRRHRPHFTAVFRVLQTINNKLKLRLTTQLRTHGYELRTRFQEGLFKIHELIDCSEVTISEVFIYFQDSEDRLNEVTDLCNFLDVQEEQLSNSKWKRQFLLTYNNTKIFTYF
ncbi:hypothetical protein M3Y95_01022900 [Aphelenchoides besseyi]|nr:hypothetical protein M3Y95_01022900 [Aphelenchoides besseyi]